MDRVLCEMIPSPAFPCAKYHGAGGDMLRTQILVYAQARKRNSRQTYIAQVFTDGREVVDDWDLELFQMGRRADTRKLKDLR